MCFSLLKIFLTLHSRPDEVLDDLCSLHDERERKFLHEKLSPSLISLVKFIMLLLKTCSYWVLEIKTHCWKHWSALADVQNEMCSVEHIFIQTVCDGPVMNAIYSHILLNDWFMWQLQTYARAQAQSGAFLRLLVGQAMCKLLHCWKCMADSSAGIINMSARATTPKSGPAVGTTDLRAVPKSKSLNLLACQLVAPHAPTKTNQTQVVLFSLVEAQFSSFCTAKRAPPLYSSKHHRHLLSIRSNVK